MTLLRSRSAIPAGHPALAGHFPGDPIVPGVVLLEAVLAAVTRLCGPCALTEVTAVKFLSPLRPDEPFDIELSPRLPSIRFRCLRDDVAIASGVLEVTAQ